MINMHCVDQASSIMKAENETEKIVRWFNIFQEKQEPESNKDENSDLNKMSSSMEPSELSSSKGSKPKKKTPSKSKIKRQKGIQEEEQEVEEVYQPDLQNSRFQRVTSQKNQEIKKLMPEPILTI